VITRIRLHNIQQGRPWHKLRNFSHPQKHFESKYPDKAQFLCRPDVYFRTKQDYFSIWMCISRIHCSYL